jgi:hypothetical protein
VSAASAEVANARPQPSRGKRGRHDYGEGRLR